MMRTELKVEELELVNGGDDSGYLYDAARQAEEAREKRTPIVSIVTWTHLKIIANSIWTYLRDTDGTM